MVESELRLFQMQVKGGIGQSIELHQPGLGKCPEGLDAVDMVLALDELIGAVLDPVMFFVAQIDQAVVASPAVGVDDALWVHFTPYDGLKSDLGAVRDDLSVDLAAALKNTEDRRLAGCSSSSFTLDSLRTEVGFINLDLASQGRFMLAHFGDADAYKSSGSG